MINLARLSETKPGSGWWRHTAARPTTQRRIEVFTGFQRRKELVAVAHVMETANSSWIPQFGTKSDRKMLGAAGQHAEPADADEQIEALDEDIVFDAAAFSVHDDAPVRLTMQLIRESSALAGLEMSEPSDSTVSDEHDESSGDEVDELLRKKVLRLDWLNIGRIENLDAFTHVRELYLQHNLIERIENLDDHAELTFLALGGNRIHKVEGLRHLSKVC